MTIDHIETAIIGAGQAGLATAYHLQRRGRPCLILDSNARVGDNWRCPLGLAAAVLPGRIRRPARPAIPGLTMVLSDQGPGRRLPGQRTPNGSSFRCAPAPTSTGASEQRKVPAPARC